LSAIICPFEPYTTQCTKISCVRTREVSTSKIEMKVGSRAGFQARIGIKIFGSVGHRARPHKISRAIRPGQAGLIVKKSNKLTKAFRKTYLILMDRNEQAE
jgi:hypothetical protein